MPLTIEQKKARRIARKEQKKAIANSEWKKFEGDELPEIVCWHKSKYDTDPKGTNIFQYPGGWVEAYYKGDNPETATEWIIATANGGFYKVGALYMIWHPNGSKACWSGREAQRTIKELILTRVSRRDPNYQT